ncbi:2-deoxystreptamine glucosyltransferase [Pedobacter glucosidilyticus]|nr:2-deoxystreptamine glucosyltransferase [Pedobacter glucosidilyticus]
MFFPAWFPNKYNYIGGNFALEHAKALQGKVDLSIFHVCEDFTLNKVLRFEDLKIEDIRIFRIYFKRFESKFLYPINALFYALAIIYGFIKVKRIYGLAEINHVHVLTRTAILPFFIKQFYDIPYVISEHWSRYLPSRNTYNGCIRKKLTRFLVKGSSGICTVSKDLKLAMEKHGLKHARFNVISNTVNDFVFKPDLTIKNEKYKFLHVSGLQDSIKNISGILRATAKLKEEGFNFELHLVGDDPDRIFLSQMSEDLELSDRVIFHGKLYGDDLIAHYQQADAFVLFSNFENQPCVLLESLCCGMPVITTKVGGISEFVNQTNGVCIEAKDELALFMEMRNFINGNYQFDKQQIRDYAINNFGYHAVAKELLAFYNFN